MSLGKTGSFVVEGVGLAQLQWPGGRPALGSRISEILSGSRVGGVDRDDYICLAYWCHLDSI